MHFTGRNAHIYKHPHTLTQADKYAHKSIHPHAYKHTNKGTNTQTNKQINTLPLTDKERDKYAHVYTRVHTNTRAHWESATCGLFLSSLSSSFQGTRVKDLRQAAVLNQLFRISWFTSQPFFSFCLILSLLPFFLYPSFFPIFDIED